MAVAQNKFDEYLAEEVRKIKGVATPVRSSLLRRIFVRRVPPARLHPNPEDEFCNPEIGPNKEIISRYGQIIRDAREDRQRDCFKERITVERIRPDGYMILNGHHRWAAAVRNQVAKVPVRIVNITRENDILDMLRSARRDKRVTLDLDEVVFCASEDEPAEKAPPFPFRRFFPERLRLGIPALFRFLGFQGYDIWVYTARLESHDHIRTLLRLYHSDVCGIVTGTERKHGANPEASEDLKRRIAERYPETLHIDGKTVLSIDSRNKSFREFPLSGAAADWSREIMEIVERLKDA
ncbi:MAG: ParB/RepB/Spo0J family partition protein [Clostridiales bacterium]|nr:ParB/RepB/Spo0J family partition protein [Clostridiales bacterium]